MHRTRRAHQTLGCTQRQVIAIGAETDYPAVDDIRDSRMMAKGLAPIDVGQVNFDNRYAQRAYGIADSDARMRVGGGVDNERVDLTARFLNAVDDRALAVGLKRLDRHSELEAKLAQPEINLRQRRAAVNSGLAFAKHIEIRPMHHQHRRRIASMCADCRSHRTRPLWPRRHPCISPRGIESHHGWRFKLANAGRCGTMRPERRVWAHQTRWSVPVSAGAYCVFIDVRATAPPWRPAA